MCNWLRLFRMRDALVVCLNKWDIAGRRRPQKLKDDCERKLYFVDYAETLTISAPDPAGARQGHDRDEPQPTLQRSRNCSTPKLTRALQDAIVKAAAAARRHHPPKMRYAHRGGSNPPWS